MERTVSQPDASALARYTAGPHPYNGVEQDQPLMHGGPDPGEPAPSYVPSFSASQGMNSITHDFAMHPRPLSLASMKGQKRDSGVFLEDEPQIATDLRAAPMKRKLRNGDEVPSWYDPSEDRISMPNATTPLSPRMLATLSTAIMDTNKALPPIPALRYFKDTHEHTQAGEDPARARTTQIVHCTRMASSSGTTFALSPLPEGVELTPSEPRDRMVGSTANEFGNLESSLCTEDTPQVQLHLGPYPPPAPPNAELSEYMPQPQELVGSAMSHEQTVIQIPASKQNDMFIFNANRHYTPQPLEVDTGPTNVAVTPKQGPRKFVNFTKLGSSIGKLKDRFQHYVRHDPMFERAPSSPSCHTCGRKFPSSTSLEEHASANGCRAYICKHPGCNLTYSTWDACKRHSRSHKAKKDYPCLHEGCDRNGSDGFIRKDALNLHMKNHHPKAWDALKQAYPKYCTEPDCEHARVGFPLKTEQQYVAHMGSQHGMGRYGCLVEGCKRVGKRGYFKESDRDAHMASKHSSSDQDS